MYLIFQIEKPQSPTYRIENRTRSLTIEYYQLGISPSSDCIKKMLAPEESTAYSWTDPERSKTKKVLCCNLNLVN